MNKPPSYGTSEDQFEAHLQVLQEQLSGYKTNPSHCIIGRSQAHPKAVPALIAVLASIHYNLLCRDTQTKAAFSAQYPKTLKFVENHFTEFLFVKKQCKQITSSPAVESDLRNTSKELLELIGNKLNITYRQKSGRTMSMQDAVKSGSFGVSGVQATSDVTNASSRRDTQLGKKQKPSLNHRQIK